MAFFDLLDIASSLRRIAEALELMNGQARPQGSEKGNESDVSYLDDKKEFYKELRRSAYERRTGSALPPGEDVPRPAEERAWGQDEEDED